MHDPTPARRIVGVSVCITQSRNHERHEKDLSDDAAHWMAVLAMDQYPHLVAARLPGGVLVTEPCEIARCKSCRPGRTRGP